MGGCVCVLDGEGSSVFGSRAQTAVQTAVYLPGYIGYLTCFCEPLSPPYTCHTSLKIV